MGLEKLMADYPYRTELHAHTKPISSCSEVTADELVSLYRPIADTVVLTNHFIADYLPGDSVEEQGEAYWNAWREARSCGEKQGLCVIPGMELRFTESFNDYLIYGVDEATVHQAFSYLDKGIRRYYADCKTEERLIYQAHPFRDGMTLAPLDCLDGIETFNMHPGHNSRVAVAARYARENGLPVCGGTDFHHVGHQGMCLVRTRKRLETAADVVGTLKSGDFLFEMSGSVVLHDRFPG